MTEPSLELRGIEKRFGSVLALDGADLVLRRGEVHGLLGENGAGKSTLMHVAFGMIRPDGGEILVGGQPLRMRSPMVAKASGIGMVHQHFTSIGALSVRENLWLAGGRLGHPAGEPVGEPVGAGASQRLAGQLWRGLDPNSLVETLPVGAKQRLELLQAIATGAEILLLDEPTALLAPAEVEALLGLLREFAAAGGSVVLITHKLNEVFGVADRVTVLRRGAVTLVGEIGDVDPSTVAEAMVGSANAASPRRSPTPRTIGPVRITGGGLEVRAGEIVGIAAVEGNGQRDLLRALAGVARPLAGVTVAAPVAFLPGDRTVEGLVPRFSLTENLVLGRDRDPRWSRGSWVDWGAARRRMAELIESFGIQAAGPDAPARSLSGGNQQKVLFARAADSRPAVVVAENPTRGLDFRATAEVYDRLRGLAADGVAVLVYSTDLDEVLELADRVVVMRKGQVYSAPPEATRALIGAMMVGAA
ncbi:MAG: ABC transporter ATP-binding protein [Gemmatimonadales bacterium]